jgi:FlaA1/EpsC-like NDP-sugar epimerase
MSQFSHRSTLSLAFAFVDCILVLVSVFFSTWILTRHTGTVLLNSDQPTLKVMLLVVVVQLSFYYLDLHELRNFRERIWMAVQLVKALLVSSVVLAVAYFIFPDASLDRRVFGISMLMVFYAAFFWRFLFPWITDKALFKERILIIGSGDFALNIQKDIMEHGQEAYEIVGFVDEKRERLGQRAGTDHNRGLQADLFHLQQK